MKRDRKHTGTMARFPRAVALGMALALSLGCLAACTSPSSGASASNAEGPATSAVSESPSSSASSAAQSASASRSVSSSAASSSASRSGSSSSSSSAVSTKPVTDLPEESILLFQDDETFAKLVDDMASGRIPAHCYVFYDAGGSRPEVDVTDPDQITEIYNLLAQVSVTGPSDLSITDSYHHVVFVLQDKLRVRFNFEGDDLLNRETKNYEVSGTKALWTLVQRIQDTQGKKS